MKTKKRIFIALIIFLIIAGIFSWWYISKGKNSENIVIDERTIYEDLMYYENLFLGIVVKYPRNYMVYEKAFGSAETNCITILSNEDEKAYVNIGYLAKQKSEGSCFTIVSDNRSEYVGNHNGKELKGDRFEYNFEGKDFVNVMIKADNSKMNTKENEYFAIQFNYPKDKETIYMKGIDIILNNLVWK